MKRLISFFLCFLILSGCSLFPESKEDTKNSSYNKTIEVQETQAKSGLVLVLDKIVYSHDSRDELVTLYFILDNQGVSPVILTGSGSPETADHAFILKNEERHFPMVGHGGSGIETKREGQKIIFIFPEGQNSKFHGSFKTGDKTVKSLQSHLPFVIDQEKIDFAFLIPPAE